ncbi:MAG: serine hydrolase domain-containing protein, partial [Bacillota bacterium]
MTDSTSLAQASKEVDQLLADWNRSDCPGAAVLVTLGGDVVHRGGYGCAQLEYDIPITPSTIFHVASVSKQFTALAVAMLADEGRISIDDDIRDYFPEMVDFGPTITIRHMAHHASGLRDQWELLRLAGWRMDDVITTEHIMKMVRRQRELNFHPGDEHLYCNTGYTLMAELVARVTGMSFRDYTHSRIFAPLGMESTHFHCDHQEIVRNRAYSYSPRHGGGFRKSVLNYANAGATSLFTTVEDLARWLLNFDSEEVGGREVMRQMHQRLVLNDGRTIPYAFGLAFSEHRGARLIGHSGADAGFRSYCGRFPDFGLGIAVLSNLSTFNPQVTALEIAGIYLEDRLEEEEKPTFDDPPGEAGLRACEGTYLLGPLGFIEIEREADHLVLRRAGAPTSSLIPEGDLRFRADPGKQVIEFDRDPGSRISSLSMLGPGHTMTADRFEPRSLGREQLADFCGDYYSQELGTA